MSHSSRRGLSRREMQIVEILSREKSASVAVVRHLMPAPPSYSAVRTHLNRLERRGVVTHTVSTASYIYHLARPAEERNAVIRATLDTFCGGSTAKAIELLLALPDRVISLGELRHLAERIAELRAARHRTSAGGSELRRGE